MSWDIYGEPLRRGHCEVHPYVHEEYPCSVCISDKRSSEQQVMYKGTCESEYLLDLARERISEHLLGLAREYIEELEKEKLELYEALEELVKQYGHPNISGWVDIERATVALAKARGES